MPDVPGATHTQADAEHSLRDIHTAGLRAVETYAPDDRPPVLVHVDGDWHPGELRQWSRDPAGGWWAQCSWRRAPGATFLDTFPAQRVWEDREDVHPANA